MPDLKLYRVVVTVETEAEIVVLAESEDDAERIALAAEVDTEERGVSVTELDEVESMSEIPDEWEEDFPFTWDGHASHTCQEFFEQGAGAPDFYPAPIGCPHFRVTGQVVRRGLDRGVVVSHAALSATVEWENGAVEVLEQHEPAVERAGWVGDE